MPLESLDKLRTQIRRIEGRSRRFGCKKTEPLQAQNDTKKEAYSAPAWSLGTKDVDQFFPEGLSPHGLHEITPACYQESWSALSFALALLSRKARLDERPILWCTSSRKTSEFGQLYGHGLQRFNMDPARFIVIETKNDMEASFVLEEALKSAQVCAALGQVDVLSLTPSRRLSLMAAKGKTPALLLTTPDKAGIRTAATRWQTASAPSSQQLFADVLAPQSAPPPLAWQVTLTRNRQGPADKKWYLEFPSYDFPLHNHGKKAFRFTQPSPFRNRKPNPLEGKEKAA